MKQKTISAKMAAYNAAVQQAYETVEVEAILLLSTIWRDDLRLILERKVTDDPAVKILRELISPLLYLRLDIAEAGESCIRFGIQPAGDEEEYAYITSQFLRALFHETSSKQTTVNVEACIRTDWFINRCDELFEYLDMELTHHTMRMLPHNAGKFKRKKVMHII